MTVKHMSKDRTTSLSTITVIGGGAWLIGKGSGLLLGYNSAIDGMRGFADAAPWMILFGVGFVVLGGVLWWRT